MRDLIDHVRSAWTVSKAGGALRRVYLGAVIWVTVSLASAIQGYVFAAYRGREQDWWPTLAYTAAIFSVWALMTPIVIKAAEWVSAQTPRRVAAIAIAAAGFPMAIGAHLLIFVVLFWPVYGSGAATSLDMITPVFLANLDKAVFAYAAMMAFVGVRNGGSARAADEETNDQARSSETGLWVRVAGGMQFVGFNEIDVIAAAGDYAEVHAGARLLLTDRSLTALAEQLPKNEFARIHRGTILRLDRVREVKRLGRGDADIRLYNGEIFRLSRRYRENLTANFPL